MPLPSLLTTPKPPFKGALVAALLRSYVPMAVGFPLGMWLVGECGFTCGGGWNGGGGVGFLKGCFNISVISVLLCYFINLFEKFVCCLQYAYVSDCSDYSSNDSSYSYTCDHRYMRFLWN